MSQADDIIYAPVNTSLTSKMDWYRIPIYIQLIDRAWVNPNIIITGGADPGVHYAIPECSNIPTVKIEILTIINDALNMNPPLIPAGLVHGRIRSITIDRSYTINEQDILVNLGINPIIGNKTIGLTLWGQKFFTSTGKVRSIVNLNNEIDAEFIALI